MLGLYELIDLSPAERAVTRTVVAAIDEGHTRPPELGADLHLVATDRAGQVLGAVSASAPLEWTRFDNQALNAALRLSLIEVTRLAVAHDARGRSIGRRLLEAAEQAAARRGYGLAEVTYSRSTEASLGRFYRAAGYTELDPGEWLRVLYGTTVVTLPYDDGSRIAIKPLRHGVAITSPPDGPLPQLPRLVRGLIDVTHGASERTPAAT